MIQEPKPTENPLLFFSQVTTGYQKSRALHTVVELDIARKIDLESPKPVDKLANEIQCDPDALYRLMRAISTLGIFKEQDNRTFEHTQLSKALRESKYRDIVLLQGGNSGYLCWKDFTNTIRKGKADVKSAIGKENFFDYFKDHPDEEKIFISSMTTYTNFLAPSLVKMGDFSNCETICDIGGSQGIFLNHILKNNKNIKKAINFDLQSVIDQNKKVGEERDKRIQDLAGDFFKDNSIPQADFYIMKSILHDWNDENAIRILKNVAKSMNQNSKLFVFDVLLDEQKSEGLVTWFDLNMLQLLNGRERNQKDWERISREVGLKITNIQKTQEQSFFPSLVVFTK